MPSTPPTPDEMTVLARHADLNLPDYVQADLIGAWQHVGPMIARIRRGRAYGDEPAHVFCPVAFDRKA
jgi:hypothetical protein